jgi:hypothetical protein
VKVAIDVVVVVVNTVEKKCEKISLLVCESCN